MYSVEKFKEVCDRKFADSPNDQIIFVKNVEYPFLVTLKYYRLPEKKIARINLQNDNTSEVREQFRFLVTSSSTNYEVSTSPGICRFLRIFKNARNFRKCVLCQGNFTAEESGLCFTCEISRDTDIQCVICMEKRDSSGNHGKLLTCCNKIVHQSCIKKWNTINNEKRCVHCRSPIWKLV